MSNDSSAKLSSKKRKASNKSCGRYQDLSEDEKNEKQQYCPKRHENFPDDKKTSRV